MGVSTSTRSPTGTNPHYSEEVYAPAMPTRNRANSENYYEDVDPRFAVGADDNKHQSVLPSALTPGAAPPSGMPSSPTSQHHGRNDGTANVPQAVPMYHLNSPKVRGPTSDDDGRPQLPLENMNGGGLASRQIIPSNSEYLEAIPDGARSPGEGSDTSHFTSVSQRGVNPQWMPPPGMGRSGMTQVSSASAAQRRKEDVILTANPDFSLPGMPGQKGRGNVGPATQIGRGPMNGGVLPASRYPVADI